MIATFFVPVVNQKQEPLMPTIPSRANRWINSGKATPFWKKGVFCVRLNQESSDAKKQQIAIGVDPGSKKEGFTVKSRAHTYLNVQTDAVQHVKGAMKTRREMRQGRRFRNTPCRKPRWNRASLKKKRVPPSTKARWQWKLTIINWLKKLFPVTDVIVEDIKARSKGKKRWDQSFSPLEVGKQWFYAQISNLTIKQGYETKALRDQLGLEKSKNKLSDDWSAHCVDSWVLANSIVGGDVADNKRVLLIAPIRLHRRQLHKLQPKKGKRNRYGGTISLGLKRGSLVKHSKYGVVYVGGNLKNRISLHSVETGVRLCQNAKIECCKFLTYNRRRVLLPQS